MSSADKIVQQISVALTEKSDRVFLERLAADYAAQCHAVNRRLEQCCAMLDAGDQYQAIQLAETPPVLLDLVALLSFNDSDAWRTLCRTNNLPLPERLNERAVSRLNELYSKGISPQDPLYRDYRTAMVERKEEKALNILRSIIKLNAHDETAKSEFARLEAKVRDQKLSELDKLLENRDEPAALAALASLEAVFRQPPLTGPIIERARAVRLAQDRQQAAKQCELSIAAMTAQQVTGNWKKAFETAREVELLCTRHAITLEPALAKQFQAVRAWAADLKAQFDQEQRQRESLQKLHSMVAPGAPSGKQNRESLEANLESLNNQMAEMEVQRGSVAPEVAELASRRTTELRQQIDQSIKQQRLLTTIVAALVVIALACGAAWYWRQQHTASLVESLRHLQATRQTTEVKQRLDELQASAQPPKVQQALQDLEHYLTLENERRNTADAKIQDLDPYFNGVLTNQLTADIVTKVKEAETAYNAVAPPMQGELTARLTDYQQQLKFRLTAEKAASREIANRREERLNELATAAEAGLVPLIQPGDTMATLSTRAHQAAQTVQQMTGLMLPEDTAITNRVAVLKARLDPLLAELTKLEAATGELRKAQSIEEYFLALGQFNSETLAELPEIQAAGQIQAVKASLSDVEAALLMPKDNEGWTFFKANPNAEFHPGEILPPEVGKLLALRDDDNLRNVYRYETPKGVTSKPPLTDPIFYSRGAVQLSGGITGAEVSRFRFSGSIFIPAKDSDRPRFTKKDFAWEARGPAVNLEEPPGALSPESTAFTAMGLTDLVDPQSNKFRGPLLSVLDALRASATSPLFRAFVHYQLLDLISVRPVEWGTQWSPAMQEDFRRLKELGAADLQSGDWMIPGRIAKYEARLTEFYQGAGTNQVSYAKQARLNQALTQQASAAGVSYAGFVGVDHQPALTADARGATELWGLTTEGAKLALVYNTPPKGGAFQQVGRAQLLSPLFILKTDRLAALHAAEEKTDVTRGDASVGTLLSPLFQ